MESWAHRILVASLLPAYIITSALGMIVHACVVDTWFMCFNVHEAGTGFSQDAYISLYVAAFFLPVYTGKLSGTAALKGWSALGLIRCQIESGNEWKASTRLMTERSYQFDLSYASTLDTAFNYGLAFSFHSHYQSGECQCRSVKMRQHFFLSRENSYFTVFYFKKCC